jgi:hypothetical protein
LPKKRERCDGAVGETVGETVGGEAVVVEAIAGAFPREVPVFVPFWAGLLTVEEALVDLARLSAEVPLSCAITALSTSLLLLEQSWPAAIDHCA